MLPTGSTLNGAMCPVLLAAAGRAVHSAAVIKLHSMPGADGLESLSPFCMKVEVYLELQNMPYESTGADPRKAPKGKLPFIEIDGKRIADSTFIFEALEKKAETPLDRGLDAAGRAQAHALKRLFEESLYWCILWSRWVDEPGWVHFKKVIDGFVPAALRWLVPGMIRKKVTAQVVSQGTGRHTRDEIYAIGKADLEAIAEILGDKPYLLGNQLRTIDVTAYAWLANILMWKYQSPLAEIAREHPNLVAYVDRIAARLKMTSAKKAGSGQASGQVKDADRQVVA
jgi:glutathione S-transferase